MRYEEISAFKVAVSVKVARMPVQNWSQVQNQMWRQQSKILKFYLHLTWRGLRVASSGHGWWFGDLLRHTENSRRELASSGNLSEEKRHCVAYLAGGIFRLGGGGEGPSGKSGAKMKG